MLTTAIVQLLLAKPPCLCVVILIMSVCNLDLKYDNKKKLPEIELRNGSLRRTKCVL